MNTRTRSKQTFGLPKPRTLAESSPSSSSASSDDSEMEVEESANVNETIEATKDAAASLGVLQLSDEDEGPRIGTPINTSAEDDLDSIDSKLLFRSSPPPAIPSTSRAAIAGPSGTQTLALTRNATRSTAKKSGPSTSQPRDITPTGVRKDIRKQFSTLIEKCQGMRP